MQLYPVISRDGISEIWHGEKLTKEVPDRFMPPMIKLNNLHWYVGELVRLRNGRHFIPLRWIQHDHEMNAQGHMVDVSDVSRQFIYLMKIADYSLTL
jgi:hypothetical protein